MRIRLMMACLALSLSSSTARAQLFYNGCAAEACVKAYIEKKEKIGEELYLVRTIFLTYHRRNTTNADERNRTAKVSCNKDKPSVAWGSEKARAIDKNLFRKARPKQGKFAEPEKASEQDETTSLWKKVCPSP